MSTSHRDLVLDQFTRQAVPFSTAPSIQDEQALKLVVNFAGTTATDTVLDVACGPGILLCAFARVARRSVGIDLTPAMLDRARVLQREKGLGNMSWVRGDGLVMPFKGGAFSMVTSRFAFHHLLDPAAALVEMARVCAPGGRIVVVDSAPAADKADAFNRMEVVRDPSHVRAMPLEELRGLFARARLPEPRTTSYRLEGEVEGLIKRSFPLPGDDETLRQIFAASIERDGLGVNAWREGNEVHFSYPVAVLVADR